MAAFAFNEGIRLIHKGDIRLGTDVIKVMLVNSTYIPTQDNNALDSGSGTGIVTAEINVTNYTPGPAVSNGRTVLASGSMTFVKTDASDRSTFGYGTTVAWTNLGSGASIFAAIIYKHASNTDDLLNIPIFYLPLEALVTTNGANFTLQFNAAGIHYFQN